MGDTPPQEQTQTLWYAHEMGIILARLSSKNSRTTKNNPSNTLKGNLDQYVGTWTYWNPHDIENKRTKTTMVIDGKGNFTETTWTSTNNKNTKFNGTYKVQGNVITFTTSSRTEWGKYNITSNTVFTKTDGVGKYYKD